MWTGKHPGGRVLLSSLGATDSTDVFAAFHTGATYAKLTDFYIGDLDTQKHSPEAKQAGPSAFELEYRALNATMKAQGLFKAK
jgi:hypothetical protein